MLPGDSPFFLCTIADHLLCTVADPLFYSGGADGTKECWNSWCEANCKLEYFSAGENPACVLDENKEGAVSVNTRCKCAVNKMIQYYINSPNDEKENYTPHVHSPIPHDAAWEEYKKAHSHCNDWDSTRKGMKKLGLDGYASCEGDTPSSLCLLWQPPSHSFLDFHCAVSTSALFMTQLNSQLLIQARPAQRSVGILGAKPIATMQPAVFTPHVHWTRMLMVQSLCIHDASVMSTRWQKNGLRTPSFEDAAA